MSRLRQVNSHRDLIPTGLKQFIINRFSELIGILLMLSTIFIAISLMSWHVDDPSINSIGDGDTRNIFGFPGAVVADAFMQTFGLGVIIMLIAPLSWAVRLMGHGIIDSWVWRCIIWFFGGIFAAGFMASLPISSIWPLSPTGLGGSAGDLIIMPFSWFFNLFGGESFSYFMSGVMLFTLMFFAALFSSSLTVDDLIVSAQIFGEHCGDFVAKIFGALGHFILSIKSIYSRFVDKNSVVNSTDSVKINKFTSIIGRLANFMVCFANKRKESKNCNIAYSQERLEPGFTENSYSTIEENLAGNDVINVPDIVNARDKEISGGMLRGNVPTINNTQAKKVKNSISSDGFLIKTNLPFTLPSLDLLSPPDKHSANNRIPVSILRENSQILEGVLADFGVKGEIINVRPGPVVTLYELEPAPGIKSSRVISLADDIARSMSAISARVAVVPGRNAIGIELPNSKRNMVYLRELLSSGQFKDAKFSLPIALGKNIGGDAVITDLAKMPHLLIAGTTGSGKSVGVNTMILSLLYKLPPEKCKLIMIDPKMLELSIYDGIPHLLTPVVTDPKKAVVALKWAVKEMEDRYQKMAKLGVRNIDGFNARVSQAKENGEVLSRTVQTGYDMSTGQPIYETEHMELEPLPYIVIIVDEMADLMMVAGKDIEGAIQRLAQMARAAGIHMITATQRPSVDVITGTIKANFPTRISFQVTSKIDSRTILGEQGAEQLLGQGDMLYMAGGGRISRVHGAFVSDEEVENIVSYLKTQGMPQYLEAVTEEPEDGSYDLPGSDPKVNSGDELYDQAVAIVARDKKASTSYIQRRLSIGYNKAATLIERMEEQGIISPANHAGKREILIEDHSGAGM